MKIAAISASRIPSTTANSIQVMKTCQALVQLGHDLHLYIPDNENAPAEQAKLDSLYGLDVSFPIRWLQALPVMRRYDFSVVAAWKAYRIKPDLVLTWTLQAALAAQVMGLPVVLELHGPPEGKMGPILFRKFSIQPGRKRIGFITNALRQLVVSSYPDLSIAPISIIAPNGIELEKYTGLPSPAAAREELGLAEKFTAMYSGHLYPGRGMGMLVNLAKKFPEVQFIWIGGREEAVRDWRTRLAMDSVNNVQLLGFIPNQQLPRYQAAADILLMPYEKVITGSSGGNSASYASPMKMFEYMACGRPILTSDLQVIREILNQENSLLCPPEDVDSWTKAFQKLLDDGELRHRLSERALHDVRAYSWTVRARNLVAGFNDD